MFLLLMQGDSEGQVASNYNSSTSDSGYDGDTAMSLNGKKGAV